MNSAAKSVLYFVAIGLILSGAIVAVFEVSHPFAKYGTVAVYFAYASTPPQVSYQVDQYMVTTATPSTQASPMDTTVVSLEVTIDSVQVHSGTEEETGWTTVSNETVTLDLLKESGESVLLGSANVAEQNITMVRMHVASATATIENSTGTFSGQSVIVSSGEFKIPVTALIRGQLTTSITLSPESVNIVIQGNGQIRATPVLHVKSVDGPE